MFSRDFPPCSTPSKPPNLQTSPHQKVLAKGPTICALEGLNTKLRDWTRPPRASTTKPMKNQEQAYKCANDRLEEEHRLDSSERQWCPRALHIGNSCDSEPYYADKVDIFKENPAEAEPDIDNSRTWAAHVTLEAHSENIQESVAMPRFLSDSTTPRDLRENTCT